MAGGADGGAAAAGAAGSGSGSRSLPLDLDKIRLDPFKVMMEARVALQNNDRWVWNDSNIRLDPLTGAACTACTEAAAFGWG